MKEQLIKFIRWFLVLGPFLDMATAVMLQVFHVDLTLGMIVRFLFLAVCCFYLFFYYQGKNKKYFILALGGIFIYLGLFSIAVFVDKGSAALFYEIKNAFKTFYLPLTLLSLGAVLTENKDMVPKKYFFLMVAVYLLGVFIPDMLGIGFDSYQVTKTGSVGFFQSANEISAILSLLMPFFLSQLYQDKQLLKSFLWMGILIYVVLSIGTKGPVISLLLIAFVYLLIFFVSLIKKSAYQKFGFSLGIVLVVIFSFLLILPKTAFYQNMKVHLDFLKVEHMTEVFQDEALLDHFVFSSRLKFFKNTAKSYQGASIFQKLVGIGYIEHYGTDQVAMKMVEMDYVDIFFRHGVVGFLVYMGIYGDFLIGAFKGYLKAPREKQITYFLSIGLSILLALITGHVLVAPAVSIFVSLLLLDGRKEVVRS